MIKLKDLSSEARGILVKAIPLYRKKEFWEDKEYIKLYQEFLGATKTVDNPPGFNKFNLAILQMKRAMPILTYKDYNKGQNYDFDIVTKNHIGSIVRNARRGEN